MTGPINALHKTVVLAYTDVSAVGSRALLCVKGVVDDVLLKQIDLPQVRPACIDSSKPIDSQKSSIFPVVHCSDCKVSCIIVNTQLPAKLTHYVTDKIMDLCSQSGVEKLVVLSALRLEGHEETLYENCLFSAEPLTSHNPLPETTTVGDAFLNTLIQMLLVEHIPTNLLLMSSHRIPEPNFHGDSTGQLIDRVQRLLNERLHLTFDSDLSSLLVYKGKNNSDDDMASMIYL